MSEPDTEGNKDVSLPLSLRYTSATFVCSDDMKCCLCGGDVPRAVVHQCKRPIDSSAVKE